SLCRWRSDAGERVVAAFARQAIPMVWDFAESNPFNNVFTSWQMLVNVSADMITNVSSIDNTSAFIRRGNATNQPFENEAFDAIITDPPYYDNVSYSNLSDYFYVWLKRTVGDLYPEHFSNDLTPKKSEAIAALYRHDGNRDKARQFYENAMLSSFR